MRVLMVCILSVMLGWSSWVLADDRFPPVTSKVVMSACSDCHMVFQPQMLPQRSWQTLMDGLGDHFGEDASLEEPVRQEVLAFLLAHAADVARSEAGRKFLRGVDPNKPPLRISETPYFIKEHREIKAATWKHDKVGSKANCIACHTEATQGTYDEDTVRLP